ncbi:hypothetical protein CC2G_004227 [Coprinopsis cinerea AmutBmut pab1-1]|nr:hypothetical protein CC2G_004227 [Coprinopsis cinerea AmutBmut pab1-1]
MSEIPQELLSHILDHLADDIPTLRNVCLAANRFRHPCQKLIFSTLELRHPQGQKDPQLQRPPYTPGKTLLQAFNSNPALSDYVNEVVILDTPEDRHDWQHPSWLADDDDLPEVLNRLPRGKIRRLVIKRGYRASWNHLKAPIKEALMGLCSAPALMSLSLAWVPIGLMSLCAPTVKHLELQDVDLQTDIDAPISGTSARTQSLQLETLRLDHAFDLPSIADILLAESTNQVTLKSLEKLHLSASSLNDHDHIPRLLEACSSSLEVLSLCPWYEIHRSGRQPMNVLDLSELHSLKHLSFEEYYSVQGSSCYVDPIPWICRVLETLPTPNALSSFYISIEFDMLEPEGIQIGHWMELDHVLTRKDRFPNLRRVKFDYEGTFHGVLEEAVPRIEDLMPELMDSGMYSTSFPGDPEAFDCPSLWH